MENQPNFIAYSSPFMQCYIVHSYVQGPCRASLKGRKDGSIFLKRFSA